MLVYLSNGQCFQCKFNATFQAFSFDLTRKEYQWWQKGYGRRNAAPCLVTIPETTNRQYFDKDIWSLVLLDMLESNKEIRDRVPNHQENGSECYQPKFEAKSEVDLCNLQSKWKLLVATITNNKYVKLANSTHRER